MPAADFAAAQQRIAARRALRNKQHDKPSPWRLLSGRDGTRPAFRVGQVDAELLDSELIELLKAQVGDGLKFFGTHLTDTYADYFSANPAYQQFGDQAARTVEVPNVQNSVEIWQTFRDGYSKAVIFGEGDVSSFLSDAKTQINQLAAGN